MISKGQQALLREYPLERFACLFHIVLKVREQDFERYPNFLYGLMTQLGFADFDILIDANILSERHKESIKMRGLDILTTPSMLTGFCISGLLMERLHDGSKPTDELTRIIREWVTNFMGEDGKEINDIEVYFSILQKFLGADLSDEQLRILSYIFEQGKSNLQDMEEEIIKECLLRMQNEQNAKLLAPAKKQFMRASVNMAARNGIQNGFLRMAMRAFSSVMQAMSKAIGRIF